MHCRFPQQSLYHFLQIPNIHPIINLNKQIPSFFIMINSPSVNIYPTSGSFKIPKIMYQDIYILIFSMPRFLKSSHKISYITGLLRTDTSFIFRRDGHLCPHGFRLPLGKERVGSKCPPYVYLLKTDTKPVGIHAHAFQAALGHGTRGQQVLIPRSLLFN